jgi:hypothetical protein
LRPWAIPYCATGKSDAVYKDLCEIGRLCSPSAVNPICVVSQALWIGSESLLFGAWRRSIFDHATLDHFSLLLIVWSICNHSYLAKMACATRNRAKTCSNRGCSDCSYLDLGRAASAICFPRTPTRVPLNQLCGELSTVGPLIALPIPARPGIARRLCRFPQSLLVANETSPESDWVFPRRHPQ